MSSRRKYKDSVWRYIYRDFGPISAFTALKIISYLRRQYHDPKFHAELDRDRKIFVDELKRIQ